MNCREYLYAVSVSVPAEQRKDRYAQKEDQKTRAQSDGDEQDLQRMYKRTQPLLVALADGAADHNAGCGRGAIADNRQNLIYLAPRSRWQPWHHRRDDRGYRSVPSARYPRAPD